MVGRRSKVVGLAALTITIWMKVRHGTLFFGNAAELFKRLLEGMTER